MQKQLPVFPQELIQVNSQIGFEKRGGRIYYFHGGFPIFSHDKNDLGSFRFITSQFVINGNAKQIEVARAFNVSYISVKRSVRHLKKHGPEAFFKRPKGGVAHVLTPKVLEDAQWLLYEGCSPSDVAKKLNLKANTVSKAILDGRLYKKKMDK